MDLAFAKERVHNLADVVDRREPRECDHAGLRIDLDLATWQSFRIIRRLGCERAGCFEADLELRRQEHRTVKRLGHGGQRQRAVGADDVEAAILEFDIAGCSLHHHRRHGFGFLDDSVSGALERIATNMHAARAVRAAPDRYLVGIALDETDRLGGTPSHSCTICA